MMLNQTRLFALLSAIAAAAALRLVPHPPNFTPIGAMALFSGFYPVTPAGLAACYVAAIPFFQNTLAGDLVYATLLFGGFALAERAMPRLRAGVASAA